MPPLLLNGTEFSLLREREPLPEESIWMCRQLAVTLLEVAQMTECQVRVYFAGAAGVDFVCVNCRYV